MELEPKWKKKTKRRRRRTLTEQAGHQRLRVHRGGQGV
jgi:hypothetical protein